MLNAVVIGGIIFMKQVRLMDRITMRSVQRAIEQNALYTTNDLQTKR